MTDSIEPALTPEEWLLYAPRGWLDLDHNEVSTRDEGFCIMPDSEVAVFAKRLPALIALANSALPDDDKRKLRREHIAALRNATVHDVIGDEDREQTSILRNLADALESYLPPEDA